jgi:hypothetical protein
MELVFPLIDSITASRFPMYVAFPRSEYYQLVRLPVNHQSILALGACLLLQAPPELTGPPVFTRNHLITCRGFRPRKRVAHLTISVRNVLPSP